MKATASTTTEAELPSVRSEPLFSISRFRSVLVKHGIIFPEAIEDAEGFDGERTLAETRAAYDELMENLPITGSSPVHGALEQESEARHGN